MSEFRKEYGQTVIASIDRNLSKKAYLSTVAAAIYLGAPKYHCVASQGMLIPVIFEPGGCCMVWGTRQVRECDDRWSRPFHLAYRGRVLEGGDLGAFRV